MNENRFFRWVWRFNGLMIACAVTFLLGLLIWEMTRSWRNRTFPSRTTQVLNVAPPAADGVQPASDVIETARFGAPNDTATRGIYAVPQFVEQEYANRGISKSSGGNKVNYLIIDTKTQAKTWLFPPASRIISNISPLWHTPPGADRRFLGHVLQIIETDSNVDGRLSRQDEGVFYFVPPDWSAAQMLTKGGRTLLSAKAVGEDMFEVMYTAKAQTFLRRYALPDVQLTFEINLSDMP